MSTTVCALPGDLPAGVRILDCAVSGGNLREALGLLLDRTGGRLCLRLSPVYMAFPLPCPGGVGRSLTPEALRSGYQGEPCHFSEALCTEYYTRMGPGGPEAVLFDTEESLLAKYRAMEAAGVPWCLAEDPKLRALIQRAPPPGRE